VDCSDCADSAIGCDPAWGPNLCDIGVVGDRNPNNRSFARFFGQSNANGMDMSKETIFTGLNDFIVKEIDVSEIDEDGGELGDSEPIDLGHQIQYHLIPVCGEMYF
jgi:hypothetical protein